MKRKVIALSLITGMSMLFASGCGQTEVDTALVQETEKAIDEIGEVSLDSEKTIRKAESYYNVLTDSEKAKVTNRLTLADARENYDSLVEEAAAASSAKPISEAEDAIAAIGEVSLDSEEAIKQAEKYYGILTDSEKVNVSNRIELVNAREAFDTLLEESEAASISDKAQAIYENAEAVYKKLNEVATLCCDGMDDIYGAWYFGIYKADDSTKSSFYSDMSSETPHLTKQNLIDGANALWGGSDGKDNSSLVAMMAMSDWQYCLNIAEYAISVQGDYDTISENMSEAEKLLQSLTKEYGDYEYYPKLKEYYSAVSSYVDFFKNPTGSFQQLSETVNQFENNIRTYQSDVGFLFN